MQKDILKYASISAVGTALYIGLLVSTIAYMSQFFEDRPETIVGPIIMLMLFVLSAAITSSLVFGRPLLWYLDGKKKEAVLLLCYTLLVLAILVMLIAGAFLFLS